METSTKRTASILSLMHTSVVFNTDGSRCTIVNWWSLVPTEAHVKERSMTNHVYDGPGDHLVIVAAESANSTSPAIETRVARVSMHLAFVWCTASS